MAPKIIINPRGRLANQMFQVMIAHELKLRVPAAEIYGISIPEWNLQYATTQPTETCLTLKRHKFDLEQAAYLLKTGLVGSVVIDGWGMRLSYFSDPNSFKRLFKSDIQPKKINDKQILLNVRSEDIEKGQHPRYYPLPFSFYERVIDVSGLEPVFMGQLDDGEYVSALRKKFSGAVFLPKSAPMEDFQTMRNAKNIAISVSSFAWLCSWLSESLEAIHFPVAGLYDPKNLETLLMPVDDPRYHFYKLSFPSLEERKTASAAEWAQQTHDVKLMTNLEAKLRVLSVFTQK